ncbi:MAG: biotin/lipoyl-binding protein, partial [Flavobacterium sp.]
MKTRYIIYIILLLGIGYLVYHRISENKKIAGDGGGKGNAKGGPTGPGLSVEGIVIKTTNFDSKVEITGTLEANEAVVLRSEVQGLVTGIYFKEGANVSKGSVLVKINDRDIQAQLREAITKQGLSGTNENRAKQLLEKG